MSLKDQITEDMKTAMRAKDSERLGTIRLLLAACKQKEVDERIVLDDVAVIAIVDKLIKQRKDSIAAFTQAARMDLADKEAAELKVLEAYLPARLSAEEVAAEVKAIVAGLGESWAALRAPATWARSWARSRPGSPARPTWARSAPPSRPPWRAESLAGAPSSRPLSSGSPGSSPRSWRRSCRRRRPRPRCP